jgi:hypothetical protein
MLKQENENTQVALPNSEVSFSRVSSKEKNVPVTKENYFYG